MAIIPSKRRRDARIFVDTIRQIHSSFELLNIKPTPPG
jgi:hypothetical protein